MALEGQHRVVANHAASVVGNLDQFLPARLYTDLDSRCSRIERVLEHLFHDRGWTLNDLPSSDLVGYGLGKNVNATHEIRNSTRYSGQRQFRRWNRKNKV